jgi:hypothetical protein
MALPPLEMRGPRLGRASRPAASPAGTPTSVPGGAPMELRGAMDDWRGRRQGRTLVHFLAQRKHILLDTLGA